MKFSLYRYVFLAGVALMLLSCEEKQQVTQLTEPARIAMQDAGGEPKSIELYDSGTTSTATAEFRVVAELISGNTINVTFKADPTKVDEYNKENGTDYEMAPAECYDLSAATVMLPRYNTVSSTAKVTVSTDGIPDAQTYLLPIVIDRIEGDDAARIDEEKNVVYVLIKKYVLKEPVLLDRSDWEVIYCNSEANESMYNGYPYGPVDLMLDNEPNTWWNYGSVSAPFYIVIDLKKQMYVKKIIFTPRHDTGESSHLSRGAPKNVDFAFATTVNGTGEAAMEGDYSDFEVFTNLEQFRSRLVFREEITLGGLYNCRYIKIRYNGAWTRDNSGAPDYLSTNGTYNVGMVAEFEAAGYTDSPYE